MYLNGEEIGSGVCPAPLQELAGNAFEFGSSNCHDGITGAIDTGIRCMRMGLVESMREELSTLTQHRPKIRQTAEG